MGVKSAVTVSLVEEARGGPFVFWHDLEAACRKAAELGFGAVEVFPPSAGAVDRAELKRHLDDTGLKLAAVGTGGGWVKDRLHLALPDEADRRRAREFVRSIIDLGAEFGAPAIVGSMQGRSGGGVPRDSARGWLADGLEELGEHAGRQGTVLLYEPLNRYETDQCNRVDQALALLGRLSTRHVRLLCDLFHMNIEEADIGAALRAGGDRVGHVHWVDSDRRAVGMAHLDVRPVVAALREIGYDGYASAEVFPLPDPDAAARQTIAAFRYWFPSTD